MAEIYFFNEKAQQELTRKINGRMKTGKKLKYDKFTMHTTTIFRLIKLGADCLALYMFYLAQGRYQGTNQPWATDRFCMKGLKWGNRRFRNAKAKLLMSGFIELIAQEQDERGIFGKTFIRVKFASNPYHEGQNTVWLGRPPKDPRKIKVRF